MKTTHYSTRFLIKLSQAFAAAEDLPTAADLEPTIDVQITEDIVNLANELNNDPIEIYNWVRNNIEFLPTFGSIQGSDMALQTRSGNAFDTSSLLIALLRQANIPARYTMGTVRIPVDQVMNWVGGATAPSAAQQILGQGGIPNVGITQGGVVQYVDLEHVWVEAWVDFEPSRGVINNEGDSWVPLDAAFKQYFLTDGIDIQQELSAINLQNIVDQITVSANLDPSAGSIDSIDINLIQSELESDTVIVEDYINSQGAASTFGELSGNQIIQEFLPSILLSGLPYEVLARANSFSQFPDNLRHKYRFSLNNAFAGQVFSQVFDLPAIAGKSLALSFSPKDAADISTLASFFDESISELNQFPSDIPGYLINVEAELVLDRNVVVSGGVFQLGEELRSEQSLFSPTFGWESTRDINIAGEYRAIGIITGDISQKQINGVRDRLAETESQLTSDPQSVDRHVFLGDMLNLGLVSYFLGNDAQSRLSANNANVINGGFG